MATTLSRWAGGPEGWEWDRVEQYLGGQNLSCFCPGPGTRHASVA